MFFVIYLGQIRKGFGRSPYQRSRSSAGSNLDRLSAGFVSRTSRSLLPNQRRDPEEDVVAKSTWSSD